MNRGHNANGVDRLKPEPVHAKIGHIIEIKTAGSVGKVAESAALRTISCRARCVDIVDRQFINHGAQRFFGGNNNGKIPPVAGGVGSVGAVPIPVRAARHLVTRRQAIDTGLLRVECQRILPGRAGRRHRVRLVIIVSVAGRNGVAIRRQDAVFDAVAIGIQTRMVAPVQIGKNVGFHHVCHVGRK